MSSKPHLFAPLVFDYRRSGGVLLFSLGEPAIPQAGERPNPSRETNILPVRTKNEGFIAGGTSIIRYRYLYALILFLGAIPTRAKAEDSITFKATPPNAKLLCQPGGRVGWGYVIRNNSDRYWLVPKNLNANGFRHGNPTALFDFPFLSPGGSKAIPYNPDQITGLYEFVSESSAPDGFTNAGEFILDSEWWTDDPSHGGTRIGAAPRMSAAYETEITLAQTTGIAVAAPPPSIYERQKVQQHQWENNYLAEYKSPLSFVLHPSGYDQAVMRRMIFFVLAYAIWLPLGVLFWKKWRRRFSGRSSRSLLYALIFTPSLGVFPYMGWWIGPVWTSIVPPFFGVLSSLASGFIIWLMGLWRLDQCGSLKTRLIISTPMAVFIGLFAGDWIFGGAKTITQSNTPGMDFYRLQSIFQGMIYTTLLAWVIAFRDISRDDGIA